MPAGSSTVSYFTKVHTFMLFPFNILLFPAWCSHSSSFPSSILFYLIICYLSPCRYWQEWTSTQLSLMDLSRSLTSKATQPSATLSKLVLNCYLAMNLSILHSVWVQCYCSVISSLSFGVLCALGRIGCFRLRKVTFVWEGKKAGRMRRQYQNKPLEIYQAIKCLGLTQS